MTKHFGSQNSFQYYIIPFKNLREKLILSVEGKEELETLVSSPTERMHRIERAKILLGYAGGASVSEIARKLGINRPKVGRCLNKALQLGVAAALRDLPGRGKKPTITRETKAWLLSLACRKAQELGQIVTPTILYPSFEPAVLVTLDDVLIVFLDNVALKARPEGTAIGRTEFDACADYPIVSVDAM